jgi:hypothetical protein
LTPGDPYSTQPRNHQTTFLATSQDFGIKTVASRDKFTDKEINKIADGP